MITSMRILNAVMALVLFLLLPTTTAISQSDPQPIVFPIPSIEKINSFNGSQALRLIQALPAQNFSNLQFKKGLQGYRLPAQQPSLTLPEFRQAYYDGNLTTKLANLSGIPSLSNSTYLTRFAISQPSYQYNQPKILITALQPTYLKSWAGYTTPAQTWPALSLPVQPTNFNSTTALLRFSTLPNQSTLAANNQLLLQTALARPVTTAQINQQYIHPGILRLYTPPYIQGLKPDFEQLFDKKMMEIVTEFYKELLDPYLSAPIKTAVYLYDVIGNTKSTFQAKVEQIALASAAISPMPSSGVAVTGKNSITILLNQSGSIYMDPGIYITYQNHYIQSMPANFAERMAVKIAPSFLFDANSPWRQVQTVSTYQNWSYYSPYSSPYYSKTYSYTPTYRYTPTYSFPTYSQPRIYVPPPMPSFHFP